ncbi:MAG TPA: trehalose-6-phosphate synthase [Solirubrobacterales bacterium]|nr:trehalose-6-phosphate synthase [Solirubrobacterales bacterium]
MDSSSPLIIVSNRGPAQFELDESGQRTVRRGGGGLVTALSGLVSHRDALWIASAITDEDVAVSDEADGGPVELSIDGIDYRVRLVGSDPTAYDLFYNVIANPILWFIQHYLWDLSNAPDIRQEELDAWDYGYQAVNRDIAEAVLSQIEGQSNPLVMLHDYHLYTAPRMIREQRDDVFLHHFVHIPWSQPDSWRVLPTRIRAAIFDGLLANDILGFHTLAYCINFLRCCDELLEAEVDYANGEVHHAGGRTLARAYPLGIDAQRLQRAADSPEVAEAERDVLERRRKYLIIRVDRADLSKNVLRGFTAFDTFLAQHPEFREEVTFIAHLQPSRQDVPEYAEYLERIEALVAVVNQRHGTTDWMPIDLRIYENFHDAVARYKHFDLLMVNALFDGMNLVAKEAPAVNTRDGVLMLSENTGSHQELWDFSISVNPFDIQEQADAIYRALTMPAEQKRAWSEGLKQIIFSRNPGDWVDDQLEDIAKLRASRA